jgi:hypothetical protein
MVFGRADNPPDAVPTEVMPQLAFLDERNDSQCYQSTLSWEGGNGPFSRRVGHEHGVLAVVNGAHRRTISPFLERCPSRGAITTLDVVEGPFGGSYVRLISDETPLQCRQ